MGYIGVPQTDGGTITVFYPTDAPEMPAVRGPFQLSWAEGAAPIQGNGRLIVISHGSGGSPWVHADLARTLVRHGFVVALPQHAGDNYLDSGKPGPDSWKRRPLEVSNAIDRVQAHPSFSPLLRRDSVGVFGGSAGGHTALTLAGGEWSSTHYRDHCLRNIEKDFSSCVGFTTLLRGDWFDGLKVGLAKWVIRWKFDDDTVLKHKDPRVRAAVAMVPFAADFSAETLKEPATALGLIVADRDINQVPVFHSEAVLKSCRPRCELIARLEEAGHGAMLSPLPPLQPGSIAQHLLSDPPGFDRERQVPQLNEAVAGFFLRHLVAQ